MIIHIINTLLPVFSAIAIGYLLARRGVISMQFLDDLNHFIFWVALPAFIISTLGKAGGIPSSAFLLFGVFHGGTFLLLGLSYIGLRMCKFEKWRQGTFLQAILRGNIAFIAIPVLSYALRNHPKEEITSIIGHALFLFAPTMVVYNVTAVLLLSRSAGLRDDTQSGSIADQLKSIARNPLILSSAIGIVLALLPWKLPGAVMDSFGYIGQIAGPAALICVGGSMVRTSISDHFQPALITALLKVVALPLITLLVALPCALPREDMLILMIFAASPSAVASYIMAKNMHGDAPLASSSIIFSTILSVVSLSIIVAFFG